MSPMPLETNVLLVRWWIILTRLITPSVEAATARLATSGKLLNQSARLVHLLLMGLSAGLRPALVIISIRVKKQINVIFAPA